MEENNTSNPTLNSEQPHQTIKPPKKSFKYLFLGLIGCLIVAILVWTGYLLGEKSTLGTQNQSLISPTHTISETITPINSLPPAHLKTYESQALGISFQYPVGWFVDTSDTTYLRVQNYDPATAPGRGYDPSQDKGKYLVIIRRTDESFTGVPIKGVKTIQELKSKLPQNGADAYYIGDYAGKLTNLQEKEISQNGLQGLYREYGYTEVRDVTMIERYFLDGKGNVISIEPGLDKEGGKVYLEEIVSSLKPL